MTFVLPHHKALRPYWLIRLGLWLYDSLGKRRKLKRSFGVKLQHHAYGQGLQSRYQKAFAYSDCWVDDARLVVLTAKAAEQLGATIVTHEAVTGLKRENHCWHIQTAHSHITANAVVNATGPWIGDFLNTQNISSQHNTRLIQGSHIVVPKCFEGEHAYILQQRDGRVVFAIPYETDYTLIGTTDFDIGTNPNQAITMRDEERDYLIKAVAAYLNQPPNASDIVWHYAGVRPLLSDEADSPKAVTRDYLLELNGENGQAPLLNVYGGKITTHRKLAEQALDKLTPYFSHAKPASTTGLILPGGDIKSLAELTQALQTRYPNLPFKLLERCAKSYGSLSFSLLNDASTPKDLGQDFGYHLHQREVDYLLEQEWAKTAQDILFRRSKLGLRFSSAQIEALNQYLANKLKP